MTVHRSRAHWPPPLGPRAPREVPEVSEGASSPTHTHQLPRIVVGALVGLTMAVLILGATVAALAFYTYQNHVYVEGRGQYRDQEAARLERRINDAVCDVLDTLPVSPLLNEARDKYHCHPGVPFEELPPAVREQLQSRGLLPGVEADRTRPRPTEPPEI